jgi:hypothetical protein
MTSFIEMVPEKKFGSLADRQKLHDLGQDNVPNRMIVPFLEPRQWIGLKD